MEYQVKDFRVESDKKYIGFMITDSNGNKMAIDKKVDIVDGKSDEKYVEEAFALCSSEVSEWQSTYSVVGKKWNPDTKNFE
mgnify:FL=1|tara:strand:+ start:1251 stop:1493 length:243 start_codon:yes stop_codon:yes gene_type:complete